jgi:hypothetical protein
MRMQLDDHRLVRRDAMLCVVRNVGRLRGNLTLITGASPADGRLDLSTSLPPPILALGQGCSTAHHPTTKEG